MAMVDHSNSFTVGSTRFTAEQTLDLLHQYRLMPMLLRELLIDQAIADVQLSEAEENEIVDLLSTKHAQAITPTTLDQSEVLTWELRKARIEKFKQLQWGTQIEDYFLTRKQQLDRAVYYLLRHRDRAVIQELFFRLQEGEKNFIDLVPLYSEGIEVHTKGLIGPVEMSKLHPTLSQRLRSSYPGQLLPPIRMGEWWVVVELIEWLPAQLNDHLRQQLLAERFEQWVNQQVKVELQAMQEIS